MGKEQIYEGVHIASPLPEALKMSWAATYMYLVGNGRFSELNKSMREAWWTNPHVTYYYLGRVDQETLEKAKEVASRNAGTLSYCPISINGLTILGKKDRAFAYKVRTLNNKPFEFRKSLEDYLPEFQSINLPFRPHVTITEIRTRRSLERARKLLSLDCRIGQAKLDSVGIYAKDKNCRNGIATLFEIEL